jgi:hypothetical protein
MTPALFTRTSIRPAADCTSRTSRATSASAPTSAWCTVTAYPSAAIFAATSLAAAAAD